MTVLSSAASARRYEMVTQALASFPADLREEHLGDVLAAMRRTLRDRLPQNASMVGETLSVTAQQAGVLLRVLAGMSISEAARQVGGSLDPVSPSTASRWMPLVTERLVDWVISEDTRPQGLDDYLRFHIARCMYIDPRGLRRVWQSQGMMLPLTDVYSAARLGLDSTNEVAADQELTRSGLYGEMLQDDLADALLAFEEPEPGGGESFARLIQARRWLVVLGDPGAGKTTLLKWLTLRNAQAILRGEEWLQVNGRHVGMDEESVNLGPVRLPVLVRVADYADELAKRKAAKEPLPGIYDFLGNHKLEDEALPGEAADQARLIRRYLQTGRALILFDGLDEITDTSMRELTASRIDLFIREYVIDPAKPGAYAPDADEHSWWQTKDPQPPAVGGNQVVVTSRNAGYKEAPLSGHVTITKILPLREEAIRRFTRDWCLAAERHRAMGSSATDDEIESRAAKSADGLAGEILGDPRISGLATNPLLLTMLTFVREERGPLPTHRSELYARATSVLIQRRQTGGWSAAEVVTILGPFALWLQEKSNTGQAAEGILREQVRNSLSRIRENVAETDVDEFVRSAREQAGLLVETGSGRYGFMHGTFREYLAAREIARSPHNVESFLGRFLLVPRWAEVLRMCAAISSANRPETADDVLRLILEHASPSENVLHRDLLFAASCLHEMQNITPTLAGEVIDRLFGTAAWAGENRFERLQQRLTEVLTDLSASFPHLTLPRLCRALSTAQNIAVAVGVARHQQQPTVELLDALDTACRSPRNDPFTHLARTEVALSLLREGMLDDTSYEPIHTLLDSYGDALARLNDLWLTAANLMRRNRDWVNPDLREAYQWLLERALQNADVYDLTKTFTSELLDRARAGGSELLMLWSTARTLNEVTADRWLRESYASDGVDRERAARCFAAVPAAFPRIQSELEQWFQALPAPARRTLLEYQTFCRGSSPLTLIAWGYITDEGELASSARMLLCHQAVATPSLPGSPVAFEALRRMLAVETGQTAPLARALLPRLDTRFLNSGHLHQLASEDGADLCAQRAGIMLSLTSQPFSPTEYDLAAKAIADQDGPLRGIAMAALHRLRSAQRIDDATIPQSWDHRAERLAAGDGAGANTHGHFSMTVIYDDAARLLRLITTTHNDQQPSRVTRAAVHDLLTHVDGLDPGILKHALECCRLSTRVGRSSGADMALLARLYAELPDGPRTPAARLLGEEAALTGAWAEADSATARMIDAGDLASAAALVHAAAWQLPLGSQDADALLAGIVATRQALADHPMNEAESRVFAAAALLVECASNPSGLAPACLQWVSGVGEAATAVLDALTTDKDWQYPPPPKDMRVRLADFTVRLAKRDRGMRAILDEVASALQSDKHDWQRRRAALYLADTAATAYPALFLLVAPSSLREQVLAVANDTESYSVRMLSVSVLSHFRRLDSDTLGVIARACRDHGIVSISAVLRCQSITVEHQPDIGEIVALMDSEHQPTVIAAALLLSALARSPYVSMNQKARIEGALASAVRSSNPTIDVMGVRDGRSLRSWLHDLLTDVAWRDKPPDVAPMLGSWAITGAAPSGASPLGTSPLPHDSFIKTILELPLQSGSLPPSAALLKVGNVAFPSGDELGLDDIPGPQLFHLARSIYSVIEFRVGMALARDMTDAQLDEFREFMRAKDDQGAFAWLESNSPNYKEAVRGHAEAFVPELLRSRPEIRSALHERFGE